MLISCGKGFLDLLIACVGVNFWIVLAHFMMILDCAKM